MSFDDRLGRRSALHSVRAACLCALVATAHVSAAYLGKWGPSTPLPLIPVAVAVLHTNELLMWSAYLDDGNQLPSFPGQHAYTQTAIMNLTTRAVQHRNVTNIQADMFCPGVAMMADGRVHVVGGSYDFATSIYDPVSRQWTKATKVHYGRGYSGDATLTDGRVLTFGGSWNGDTGKSKTSEVFSPTPYPTGTWTVLPKVTTNDVLTNSADPRYTDNYRMLFSMDNGNVFNAGPANNMKFITTSGQGGMINAGTRPGANQDEYSRAIMWQPGSILFISGYQKDAYSVGDWDAHVITMANQGQSMTPPTVKTVPRMNYPRGYANAVLLPSGDVIVFGGQSVPRTYTDYKAVLIPEQWNHITNQWTKLPPASKARTYHSVAVLLPDATVFTGGGGLCNRVLNNFCPPDSVNHKDFELFRPAYLFNSDGTAAARPQIKVAPASASHGAVIKVTTSVAVKSFVLIRCSSTTHGSNNDQRRVPLTIAATAGLTYSLRIPISKGVVVPGYHFLFAINGQGTPSVAKFIKILIA